MITLSSVIFIIAACNPVKQVLKDQTKLDKVAEEVIRRGYCVNETTTVKETIIKEVFISDSSESSEIKTSLMNIEFFQELPSGAKVSITKDGNVTVDCPVKVEKIYQLDVETKTIRDRSYENILKKDIQTLDSIQVVLESDLKEKEEAYTELEGQLKKEKRRFYFLVAALVVFVGLRLYKRVRSILPF
jgi:hypothetical protein